MELTILALTIISFFTPIQEPAEPSIYQHPVLQINYQSYHTCTKSCQIEDFTCIDTCLTVNHINL